MKIYETWGSFDKKVGKVQQYFRRIHNKNNLSHADYIAISTKNDLVTALDAIGREKFKSSDINNALKSVENGEKCFIYNGFRKATISTGCPMDFSIMVCRN